MPQKIRASPFPTIGAIFPSTGAGVFTVTEPGVYQITFMATVRATSAGLSYCELHVDNSASDFWQAYLEDDLNVTYEMT